MSYMQNDIALEGIQALTFEELEAVSGGSEWGDNVLKYGAVGGGIGRFFGLQGTAIGILAGAVVGTIVTVVE
jgi:hypothetical protein